MARLRRTENQLLGRSHSQEEKSSSLLTYFSLFQFATKREKAFIVLGILMAIGSASAPPLVNVLYGEFCNMLIDRQFPTNTTFAKTHLLPLFGGGKHLHNASLDERKEALMDDSRAWGIGCASFTLFQFILSFLSVSCLCVVACRQVYRIRILFFKSTICKDMAWFDSQMDASFSAKASENLYLLERGIAELVAVITFQFVVGMLSIVMCFAYSWILSLLLLMFLIPAIVSVYLKLKFQNKFSAQETHFAAKAESLAEEVFNLIRTVVAFGGEKKEVRRYFNYLKNSKSKACKKGVLSGLSNGILWFIIYSSYAAAFFFGTRLVLNSRKTQNDNFTPGDLLIVLFGMLMGLTNFGYIAGHLETISVACTAGAALFNVINTKPKIQTCADSGDRPPSCAGELEFKNVYFHYPSRPSLKILKGINMKIQAGEKIAIVGGSGCGKTTILQLIQRLYDPSQGEILLDGRNIKTLRVEWLRDQIGIVNQEPLLFSTTIKENIGFGLPSATEYEIEDAAEQANAHEFILSMKEDYDTIVGQKGAFLSGGQKQKIAIARALIRNPAILLLDEATSALDGSSAKVVQEALDKASRGRTTIIVTHKLSTIENVDRIYVLENGILAEQGTHTELLEKNGAYKLLLKTHSEMLKNKKIQEFPHLSKIETPQKQVIFEDETLYPPGRFSPSAYTLHPQDVDYSSLEDLEIFGKSSYIDVIKWSKPEWSYLVVGLLASVIAGGALPAVCIVFGWLYGILSSTDSDYILEKTDIYSAILVAIGVISGFCIFLQMYCLTCAAMKFATRMKVKYFECMIHQEVHWFDEEKNKVGILCLRLSQDALEMQKAIGTHVGVFVQGFSSIIIGSALCFFFNWKVTLVTLCSIPLMFMGIYFESAFSRGPTLLKNKSSEQAAKISIEVISNIKAVSCLGNESYFVQKYSLAIKEEEKRHMNKAWFRALTFAFGQTIPFFSYALSLWYGGILVAEENVHHQYVIMVTEILIFGAWTLGQSVILTPKLSEIKAAVGRIKYVFLRRPRISDGNVAAGPVFDNNSYIKFSNVGFSFARYPEHEVLRDFNLLIKSGESIALMGPSGGGKSTVIQLLLRFYKPTSGNIIINDVNIADYKLFSLRKVLGFVPQEPAVFNRSVKDNIAYGDNSREVSLSEIVEAAQAADIHSFIETLPLGYDTTIGTGSHLSGGQKQRIAIARVLVRKPQIFLLDQATSALDAQTQVVVQESLNSAISGKTAITISHKYNAVKKANIIYVLEKGMIKESGTHEELKGNHGLYYSIYVDDKDDNEMSNNFRK